MKGRSVKIASFLIYNEIKHLKYVNFHAFVVKLLCEIKIKSYLCINLYLAVKIICVVEKSNPR